MFKVLLTISIILILQSCSEKVVFDESSIYISMSLQENTLNSYWKGQESYYTLKEIYEDKSAIHNRLRALKTLSYVTKIDKRTSKLITLIEATKLELFKEMRQDLNPKSKNCILLFPYNIKEPLHIAKYNLSQLKNPKSTNIIAKGGTFSRKISQNIQQLRAELCSQVVSSNGNENSPKYYFKDPQIKCFKSQEDLNEKLMKALVKSKIAPDDIEMLKHIYTRLSFDISFWSRAFQKETPFNEAFDFLTNLENDILMARSDALQIICFRNAWCGNFSATKILPVVILEEPKSDQDVYLKVFVAAINEDWNYTVEAKNTEIIESKDGVTLLKITTNNISPMKISGTISISNGYKTVRTLPWEKTINLRK
jgi:hypothetical protein